VAGVFRGWLVLVLPNKDLDALIVPIRRQRDADAAVHVGIECGDAGDLLSFP
jgi:hypothetical protein